MSQAPHPPGGPGMPPSAGAGAGAAGAATDTRVSTVKTNLKYLALGNKAGVHPNSVATRGVLKTARYVLKYILHRMFRVAKYAMIGAGIAALTTGVLGTVGAGVAWFMIPSTGMGLTVGIVWGLAKFGWRHRPERFRGGWWSEMTTRAAEGRDAATDERDDAEIADAAERETQRRMDRLQSGGDIWMPA